MKDIRNEGLQYIYESPTLHSKKIYRKAIGIYILRILISFGIIFLFLSMLIIGITGLILTQNIESRGLIYICLTIMGAVLIVVPLFVLFFLFMLRSCEEIRRIYEELKIEDFDL